MTFRILAAYCRHDTDFCHGGTAPDPGTGGADTADFNAHTGCTDA